MHIYIYIYMHMYTYTQMHIPKYICLHVHVYRCIYLDIFVYMYMYTGASIYLFVKYWPSTEPSIKRCACVSKRKNSGSRWTSNKNITRIKTAWVRCSWSQWGTRCRSESQRQTEGFGPSVTHGWATQPRRERWAAMARRTLGQYSSPSLSPLTSHTPQKHQPFRE